MKAIITDLDDTLLRYDKTISKYTMETLEKCKDQGIKLFFATARGDTINDVVPIELFDGYVSNNGAFAIYQGEEIYKRVITPTIFLPFLKTISGLDIKASAQTGIVSYTNYDFSTMWNGTYIMTNSFDNIDEEVEKICILIETPEQREIIASCLPSNLNVHFTKDNLALIMNSEATKLRALSSLLNYLKISFKDTVAFGDDINDLEMLQAAGYGVAMGNALPEIKQIADFVTEDCDNDGLALVLDRKLRR